MGNRHAMIPVSIAAALVLMCAAFFITPIVADASRGERPRGIPEMLLTRLCDRQEALRERLGRPIIHPSFCAQPEPEEPTVELTADPMSIIAGNSATLAWESEHAAGCTASNGWSGDVSLVGSEEVSPAVTTTYTITCTGVGGSASDSVTVSVNKPEPEDPTVILTANPETIDEGSSSLVTWNSKNASTCEKSGGWSGATTTSGTLAVSPTATTTYTITCSGEGGSAQESVTVNVRLLPEEPNEPTVNLVAAPQSVTPGAGSATTTLTWTTTDADSCTASGGTFSGSKPLNGSEVITPSATTTFTLECTGPGGSASDSATVNFVPMIEEPEEGSLVISEVLYDPSPAQGSESGHEWVEIFNGTNEALNLGGYFLRDNSASELFVLPQGTMLASGATLLITGASSTAPTSGLWTVPENTTWVTFSGFSNQLANTGDIVELFNTASSSVDAVCWGPEDDAFDCDALLVEGNSGNSIGRIDRFVDTGTVTDWQIQTPNPGE